ncbi:hypothetical protein Bbelb_429770 [Branchiostoma belcheri]|nr:hypothetical protein Bbelb_429770 [Branchiostoma belcheri]
MATTAAKVLQATVMVAVTATIQDATRAAMSPRNDGAEDIRNYGDSGGQGNDGSQDFVNYGDSGCEAGEVTAVVGGSDDPGRDEGSDAALEAMTAVDVVAIVAAEAMVRKTPATAAAKFLPATAVVAVEAMVPKTAGNSSDSGGEVFKATTVVEAHAIVRKVATAAAKVLQATAVVAVTVTIQDATRAAMSPRNDGVEDFGNSDDSGCEAGEVTAVVGSSDDPGRDKGSDVALEAMTVVIVVTTVVDAAAIRSAYSKEAKTSAITATAAATFLTATAGVSAEPMVPKTVAITATAAAKILEDAMVPNTVAITATAAETFLMATATVAVKGMVQKTLAITAKFFTAIAVVATMALRTRRWKQSRLKAIDDSAAAAKDLTASGRAVVAATAMIQDATRAGGGKQWGRILRQITGTAAAKFSTPTTVVAAVAIIQGAMRSYGSEDCGNYGGGECEGSYGECGGRGNGDNLGRDEDGDFALEAITRGSRDDGCDCGDEISYGDGDGRGGIDNPGYVKGGGCDGAEDCGDHGDSGAKGNCRGDSDNPGRDDWGDVAQKPITAVALGDAMVRKMVTAAAKFLQATAVVAVTATIQDATREVMVPKTLAITATTAAKFLTAPAGSDGSQDFGNSDDSGCKSGEVTAVVDTTAVIAATAIIEDAAGAATAVVAAFSFSVAITETTAAKILEATVVVAATAIIQDATRACDGAEHCGIYGDSGGNISYGDGDARGGMVDLGRKKDGNAYYKAITTVVVVAIVKDEVMMLKTVAITAIVFTAIAVVAAGSDGAKDFGNSDGSGCEASEVTAVVDGSDDPGRVEGSDVALQAITAAVVDRMVPKTVAIMPKSAENFVTATAVVAAVVDNPRRDESDDVT